mgnify:CR=1 FL=1
MGKNERKNWIVPALECGVDMNKKRKINSLPAQIDLPAMEMGILDFWTQNQVFEKSVENRNGAARWSFYEGPPTANGKPGTHHIEARVFKDLFPRFQTMKGKQVIRKAGWIAMACQLRLQLKKSWVSQVKLISKNLVLQPSMKNAKSQCSDMLMS